jgi:hypothetical protein
VLASLGLLLVGASGPTIVVDGGLEPRARLEMVARDAWQGYGAIFQRVIGDTLPTPTSSIRLVPVARRRPAESGVSQLGRIELYQAQPGIVDDAVLLTLRHEMAHQFLLTFCAAATQDRLFHEAFAVAVSGEVEPWLEGPYVTSGAARQLLDRTLDLDTPDRRRALARLLKESWVAGAELPEPINRRLKACAAGGRWNEPLTLVELGSAGRANVGDALVVLSRHSGEVLLAEGEASLPMPPGSTTKPFVLAGADGPAPVLEAKPGQAEWACGEGLPKRVTSELALLRSCNGYFIDWGRATPAIATFGSFGPLFLRLGLEHLPVSAAEAIGAQPTLTLSPWAMAQAYRALADARPELMKLLRRNAEEGTLAGLAASQALSAWATKTGTVRDSQSRPLVGWIVAVSDELVVVKTGKDRMPRQLADELVVDLARARRLVGQKQAHVQVFGLVPAWQVEAACAGVGVVTATELTVLPTDFVPIMKLAAAAPILCLGAPWQVRLPGAVGDARAYAGSFHVSPLPPPPPSDNATLKEQRARRGSEIIFTTSLARYTAGVLMAEDAAIVGEARLALGRVIAHNVFERRHRDRPICDTTHCQVFPGTAAAGPADEAIFGKDLLVGRGWLLFSRGGDEPWEESRSLVSVVELLGDNPVGLSFAAGRVRYRRTVRHGEEIIDEPAELACELLRSPLKLPSCPQSAVVAGDRVVFRGRGRGHGQGLQVEWAKKSGLTADEILRQAYGPAGPPVSPSDTVGW